MIQITLKEWLALFSVCCFTTPFATWKWLYKYCVALIEFNLKVTWIHLIWVILDILLAAMMFCGNAMATSKCWLSSRLTASGAWSVNKQRNLVPRVSVWHISQALHSVTKKSQPVIQRKCYSDWVINFLLLTLVYTNSKELGINHAWLNSEGKYALLQIFLLLLFSSVFLCSYCFLYWHLLAILWTCQYAFFQLDVISLWTKDWRNNQWSTRFELKKPKRDISPRFSA